MSVLSRMSDELKNVINILDDLNFPSEGIKDCWSSGSTIYVRVETKEAMKKIIKLFPKTKKLYNDDDFHVRVTKGDVDFNFFIERSIVCTKEVVGKRWVNGYTIGGRMVEEVKWQCADPILKAEVSID